MAQFLDDSPLTMEFEDGELVQVSGARLEHMDWRSMFRLIRRLAKLNLAQELEIGRYKADVEGHEAECERLHQRNMAADVVDRRDLFAIAALCHESPEVHPEAAASRAFRIADAMEATRSKKERG